MTENLSFFEEYSNDSVESELIDVLAEPTWQEFKDEVNMTEQLVADYNIQDPVDKEHLRQHVFNLNIKFGSGFRDAKCTILGLGYRIDMPINSSNTKVIDTNQAHFDGVNIRYTDMQWQVVLQFSFAAGVIDDVDSAYYIPPNQNYLMNLKMQTLDDEEDDDETDDESTSLAETLSQDIDELRDYIRTVEFISNPPEGQRETLRDNTDNIDATIPKEYRDRDVVVTCERYYTVPDDQVVFDLRDTITDLSLIPTEHRRSLIGMIVGFEYPELKELPSDYPLTIDTLSLNDGGYCLVLRSKQDKATHYILPQTITDIV
jgi:hypothetical protein